MSHPLLAASVYWLWPCCLALSSTSCGTPEETSGSASPSTDSPEASSDRTEALAPNSSAPNSNPPNPSTTSSTNDQASTSSPPANTGTGQSVCTEPTAPAAGVSRLRRLTRQEYQNSLRDLLGIAEPLGDMIEPDESVGPFPSNAITPATDLIIEQYQSAAEKAVATIDVVQLLGCSSAPATCIDNLLGRFGTKLFRRPLDSTELAAYEAMFTQASVANGELSALREVLTTMLQSPNFLYHVEVGEAAEPSVAPTPLTPYELASRLAFFLWKSTPDDTLLATAADGTLSSPEVLLGQAQRLLSDPRAKDAIATFHERLLGVQNVAGVSKDPQLFPEFSTALAEALREETRAFADDIIRHGDGTLATLLTSNTAYLSEPLFSFYGISKPADWAPGDVTPLNESERAGLLTRGAFLATHAHPNQTSPVHRGIAVRENLLCQILPAPPATVNNVAPEPTPTTTTRQRLASHQADPTCASCHVLIDQIGLGFEHYDPIGAYREMDGPLPVDAVGEVLSGGAEASGTFDGAVELSHKLASSTVVADCVTNQWFRFALGRMESADDACTLERLRADFRNSGMNVRELLTQLVQSYAFTHVRTLGTSDELEASNP